MVYLIDPNKKDDNEPKKVNYVNEYRNQLIINKNQNNIFIKVLEQQNKTQDLSGIIAHMKESIELDTKYIDMLENIK